MLLEVYLQGVMLSAGLIIAIGAQNAYVLKQGIQNNHLFWVATICFACDFALMSLGILGVGTLVAKNEILQIILAVLGMLYILLFAYQSFKSVGQTATMNMAGMSGKTTLKSAIIGTLAITLLNPHVYLDTIVIIGGIAGTLEESHKWVFLMGSLTASIIWFYGLAYGARRLAPFFKKPNTWRVLNFLIGLMMLFIAYKLGQFVISAIQAM